MIAYELLRWTAYRSIRHDHMKWYVWIIPGGAALASALVYSILPIRPPLIGSEGVLPRIVDVMALLPGFFISALAAVATFDRPEMDEPLPRPAPTIRVYRSGEWNDFELTRRTFLTYLFSYLCIMSLLATVLCLALPLIVPNLVAITSNTFISQYKLNVISVLSGLTVLTISYVCFSIIVTTLHGVYFLSEIIHLPN